MTDIPQVTRAGPECWTLVLPDWGRLDQVWKHEDPFALWVVGEQELLFHWLDAAVDQGTEKVVLLVVDRPQHVRQHIARALLWPIEIEVRSVQSAEGTQADDCVDRLPHTPPLSTAPADGWDLVLHWHRLEQAWLKVFVEDVKQYGKYAAIGRNCEIAEDVVFEQPYWVGNYVSIGPGSRIGPGAVIEDSCIIGGGNAIARAHLGAATYLAPQTDLVDAAIHANELLNFKHRAIVKGLEAFVAGGVHGVSRAGVKRPSLKDRWIALRLYLRWRKHGYSSAANFTDFDGQEWPALTDDSLEARVPWLKMVVLGRLPLFGVTPRPETSLRGVDDEWQRILRSAPKGAISYADVMGAHDVGSEEETLHSVYQASDQSNHCRVIFDQWLLTIINPT